MRMATGGGDGCLNRLRPLKVKTLINAIKIRKLRLATHASNHIPIFLHFFRHGFVFLITANDAVVMPQDTLALFLSSFGRKDARFQSPDSSFKARPSRLRNVASTLGT